MRKPSKKDLIAMAIMMGGMSSSTAWADDPTDVIIIGDPDSAWSQYSNDERVGVDGKKMTYLNNVKCIKTKDGETSEVVGVCAQDGAIITTGTSSITDGIKLKTTGDRVTGISNVFNPGELNLQLSKIILETTNANGLANGIVGKATITGTGEGAEISLTGEKVSIVIDPSTGSNEINLKNIKNIYCKSKSSAALAISCSGGIVNLNTDGTNNIATEIMLEGGDEAKGVEIIAGSGYPIVNLKNIKSITLNATSSAYGIENASGNVNVEIVGDGSDAISNAFNFTGSATTKYAIYNVGENSSLTKLTLKNSRLNSTDKIYSSDSNAVTIVLGSKGEWTVGNDSIEGTGGVNVTIENGGKINTQADTTGAKTINLGSGTFTAEEGSEISFDATLADNSVTSDKITTTGTISGNITLGSVNITGKSTDAWATNTSKETTLFERTSGDIDTNFTMTGTATGTSDGYEYDFYQATLGTGVLTVLKKLGATLPDYIQGNNGKSTATTYSLVGDYDLPAELGTLNNTGRASFTIEGNNHKINAGTYNKGVTIGSGDQNMMTVNSTTLDGFNTFATNSGTLNLNTVTFRNSTTSDVNNNGTLNLTGDITLDEGINGTGTTYIVGDTTLKNASSLPITLKQNTVVNEGKTLNGSLINQGATTITNNGILGQSGGTDTLTNSASSTVVNNGTINSTVTNNGTLELNSGSLKDVTNGAKINVNNSGITMQSLATSGTSAEYNFKLPSSASTMLSTDGIANISNSTVKVDTTNYTKGTKVDLVSATGELTANTLTYKVGDDTIAGGFKRTVVKTGTGVQDTTITEFTTANNTLSFERKDSCKFFAGKYIDKSGTETTEDATLSGTVSTTRDIYASFAEEGKKATGGKLTLNGVTTDTSKVIKAGNQNAENNTIILTGKNTLGTIDLTGDKNTLDVKSSGNTLAGLTNGTSTTYNFKLPSTHDTMLSVSSLANISDSTINVTKDASSFSDGEITLISSDSALTKTGITYQINGVTGKEKVELSTFNTEDFKGIEDTVSKFDDTDTKALKFSITGQNFTGKYIKADADDPVVQDAYLKGTNPTNRNIYASYAEGTKSANGGKLTLDGVTTDTSKVIKAGNQYAQNNTITLTDKNNLGTIDLTGTSNTLVVKGLENSLKAIDGGKSQNYNFTLSTTGGTMLSITDATDISNSKINIDTSNYGNNTTTTLISSTAGLTKTDVSYTLGGTSVEAGTEKKVVSAVNTENVATGYQDVLQKVTEDDKSIKVVVKDGNFFTAKYAEEGGTGSLSGENPIADTRTVYASYAENNSDSSGGNISLTNVSTTNLLNIKAGTGTATNNVINLNGNNKLGSVDISGSNNTLNVSSKDNSIKSLTGEKQKYQFTLNESSAIMLSVTEKADISESTVAVDTTNYTKGTEVNLVSATGGLTANTLTYKVDEETITDGFKRDVEKTGTGVQDTSLIQFTTADNKLSFLQHDGEFFAGNYINKVGTATTEEATLSGTDPTTRNIYASFAEEGQKADDGKLTLDGVTLTDKTRVIKAGNRDANNNNTITLTNTNNLGTIDLSGNKNTLVVASSGNTLAGLTNGTTTTYKFTLPSEKEAMLNVTDLASISGSIVDVDTESFTDGKITLISSDISLTKDNVTYKINGVDGEKNVALSEVDTDTEKGIRDTVSEFDYTDEKALKFSITGDDLTGKYIKSDGSYLVHDAYLEGEKPTDRNIYASYAEGTESADGGNLTLKNVSFTGTTKEIKAGNQYAKNNTITLTGTNKLGTINLEGTNNKLIVDGSTNELQGLVGQSQIYDFKLSSDSDVMLKVVSTQPTTVLLLSNSVATTNLSNSTISVDTSNYGDNESTDLIFISNGTLQLDDVTYKIDGNEVGLNQELKSVSKIKTDKSEGLQDKIAKLSFSSDTSGDKLTALVSGEFFAGKYIDSAGNSQGEGATLKGEDPTNRKIYASYADGTKSADGGKLTLDGVTLTDKTRVIKAGNRDANNNNTITLTNTNKLGTIDLSGNSNTLAVESSGNTLAGLTNGTTTTYKFALPSEIDTTMLSVSGSADISSSTVAVDNKNYTKGTKVNLVSATNLTADTLTYKVGDKEIADGFERTVEKTGTGVQDTTITEFTTADNTLSFEQKDGEFFAGKYIDKTGNETTEDAILSSENPTTRDIYASFADGENYADGGNLTLNDVTTDTSKVIKAGNQDARNNIIILKGENKLGTINLEGFNNKLIIDSSKNELQGLVGQNQIYVFNLSGDSDDMLKVTEATDLSNSTFNVNTNNYADNEATNLISSDGTLILDGVKYVIDGTEVALDQETKSVSEIETEKAIGLQDKIAKLTFGDNKLTSLVRGEFFAGKYIDSNGNAQVKDAYLNGEDPTARAIYASFAEEGQKADGGKLTLDGVTLTDKTRVIKAGNRDASNNIIILKGANNLGSLDITGTNNTLNVYSIDNNLVNLLAKGQNLNFYITPSDMNTAGSNIMLNVSGMADIANSTVKAGVLNLGTVNKGDKISLIKAGTLNADGMKTGVITDGMLIVDLGIAQDGNSIVATIGGQGGNGGKVTADENAKSPVETQAAGISLLNTSSDMLATDAINSAESAVGGADQSTNESSSVRVMTPYATIGGSGLRINSGSHVDMKSYSINAGFAKETKNKNGKLLFGPVIEYGRGNYDSYLDNGTHGDGNSSFWGVGIIAKQSFNSGLYVDGSLRVGRMSNEYNAYIADKDMGYDNSATYYAAHIGVGNVQPINDKDSIDYYARLFYSHQNGSSATLKSGYVYDFDAIDSWRTRLGFRYNHRINKGSSLFAGLAWQHEFGSECRATLHTSDFSAEAPAPSVQGDTGILELGVKLLPNNNDKFEIDLGVNGYVGKQQGFGANAQFLWKF